MKFSPFYRDYYGRTHHTPPGYDHGSHASIEFSRIIPLPRGRGPARGRTKPTDATQEVNP